MKPSAVALTSVNLKLLKLNLRLLPLRKMRLMEKLFMNMKMTLMFLNLQGKTHNFNKTCRGCNNCNRRRLKAQMIQWMRQSQGKKI